jgi:hypothetical protein
MKLILSVLFISSFAHASSLFWSCGDTVGSRYFWDRGVEAGSNDYWVKGTGYGSKTALCMQFAITHPLFQSIRNALASQVHYCMSRVSD